ncbi:MAG: hypothetical protein ACI4QM_02380 [Alphaproteobacteria bacterium]
MDKKPCREKRRLTKNVLTYAAPGTPISHGDCYIVPDPQSVRNFIRENKLAANLILSLANVAVPPKTAQLIIPDILTFSSYRSFTQADAQLMMQTMQEQSCPAVTKIRSDTTAPHIMNKMRLSVKSR